MYLLDTNVVSELRKLGSGKINSNVEVWNRQALRSEQYLSAIGVFELERGVRQMEWRDEVQGATLRLWLDRQVLPAFEGRILPIDTAIARRCASLHVPNPRPERDALIAATALVHSMTVVTRNVADFIPTGVATINPWEQR